LRVSSVNLCLILEYLENAGTGTVLIGILCVLLIALMAYITTILFQSRRLMEIQQTPPVTYQPVLQAEPRGGRLLQFHVNQPKQYYH
jgi:hypothetical protein